MHYILEEYYGETEPNIEVIHLYLPLLFMELARTFEEETKRAATAPQSGRHGSVGHHRKGLPHAFFGNVGTTIGLQQELFGESDQKRDAGTLSSSCCSANACSTRTICCFIQIIRWRKYPRKSAIWTRATSSGPSKKRMARRQVRSAEEALHRDL